MAWATAPCDGVSGLRLFSWLLLRCTLKIGSVSQLGRQQASIASC